MKNLASICFAAVLARAAHAASWYVRPSASGNGSGSDWNNASSLSSIPWPSIRPGDTIWLAGGSYPSGITAGASGASGQPIQIVRATAGDAAATRRDVLLPLAKHDLAI